MCMCLCMLCIYVRYVCVCMLCMYVCMYVCTYVCRTGRALQTKRELAVRHHGQILAVSATQSSPEQPPPAWRGKKGTFSPSPTWRGPFMMSMHAAHKIGPTHDADAFRSLQALAQSIKDLSNMIPAPRSRDGTPGDNSARTWAILNEIRPDSLVLEQQIHSLTKGCWICREIHRLGGDNLLNEEGAAPILREGRGRRRKEGGRRPKKLERGRSQVKRVVLKARKALARGRSRGRSVNRIIIRTPPLILDTRLHDTHTHTTKVPTYVTTANSTTTDPSKVSSLRPPGT